MFFNSKEMRMKKCTLLVLAAACAVAVCSASELRLTTVASRQSPMKRQCSLSERVKMDGEGVMTLKRAKKQASAVTDTLISSAPAGTVLADMYVNSEAYGLGFGDIYYQKVDGGVGGVDVADDGYLYVQAPISQAYVWGLGSPWIKCEKKEGDVVVMHLPQLYCIDGGDKYYVQRLVPDSTGTTFVSDSVTQDVKFTWKDNQLVQTDDCLVGLCDADGEWFYMGDYNIKYTVNPDKPVAKPSGLAKNLYKMTYKSDAENLSAEEYAMVNAFVNGNAFYVDHLEDGLPNAVVSGTIAADGKSIVVPTRQYLGVDPQYNSHVYVLTGNAKVEQQGESTYFNYDQTDAVTLACSETGEVTAEYPASFVVNCGRNNLYIISDIVAPYFTPQVDKALTPADPVFAADGLRVSANFDIVKFLIPTVDVNGEELNENDLYYNVYYNDSPYEFTPDLYKGLPTAMTDIPYSFFDTNFDIYFSASTKQSTIYFYDQGYAKIGVQSVYCGGGERRVSKVVYVERPQSGISDVASDARELKSVTYYNLAGQQIAEPAAGVCIKRMQYADGTTKTEKVVK